MKVDPLKIFTYSGPHFPRSSHIQKMKAVILVCFILMLTVVCLSCCTRLQQQPNLVRMCYLLRLMPSGRAHTLSKGSTLDFLKGILIFLHWDDIYDSTLLDTRLWMDACSYEGCPKAWKQGQGQKTLVVFFYLVSASTWYHRFTCQWACGWVTYEQRVVVAPLNSAAWRSEWFSSCFTFGLMLHLFRFNSDTTFW